MLELLQTPLLPWFLKPTLISQCGSQNLEPAEDMLALLQGIPEILVYFLQYLIHYSLMDFGLRLYIGI
jgi:hypothetical protein